MMFIAFLIALCFVGTIASPATVIFGKIADGFEKNGASKEAVSNFRKSHDVTSSDKSVLDTLRANAVKKEESSSSSKNLRTTPSYTLRYLSRTMYSQPLCAGKFNTFN